MSWASVAISAGTLIAGAASKAHQNNLAKKKEKEAGARPVYNIPNPTIKNQYAIENNAQQGLSDESKLMYQQNADRSISASLDALLKSGGGVNSISDLFEKNQNSNIELAMINDKARFVNQQLLYNQNNLMSDQLDKKYQLNSLDPWKDAQQAAAEFRARGQADMQAGVAMAGSAFAGMGKIGDGNDNGGGNKSSSDKESAITYNTKKSNYYLDSLYT